MKKQSNILGLFVVVSEEKDATVYKVVDKHPDAPAYLLAYQTPRGLVTGGWMDITCMKAATPAQIQAAGY
jgi:hypothetical protein